MKSISITAEPKLESGKKAAKEVRNNGKVPCVIYGGEQAVHIQIELGKFKSFIYTPNTFLVELKVEDKTYKTIVKSVDYHPLTDQIIHVDFYQIDETKPFSVAIPTKFVGTSKGVLAGGTLQVKRRKVTVKGMLQDIPEFVEIDITDLGLSDIVRVRDISVPKLQLTDPSADVVVSIKTTRKAIAAAAEAPTGKKK